MEFDIYEENLPVQIGENIILEESLGILSF